MNRTRILDLCQAADLSYDDYTHKAGETTALIDGDDNFMVCAFAGSQSVRDWLANCEAIPLHREALGSVHNGFADAWERIAPKILPALQVNKLPLYLSGHSLGGAIALIAAGKLHRAGIPVAGVATFGAPAPGDAVFAQAVAELNIVQFTHRRDPVPRVLKPERWHRPGADYLLDTDGKELKGLPGDGWFGWRRIFDAWDHKMTRYLRAVRGWSAT